MPRRLVETDRRFHIFLIVSAAITVAAFIALGVALATRFHETNRKRELQAAFNQRITEVTRKNAADNRRQDRALEGILCFARRQVATADATPAQKARALDFYDNAFRILHIAQPCQERR